MNNFLREPKPNEFHQIYMMGFDVWGEGITKEDYLLTCETTPKYKKGHWYVLVSDCTIVSSLIIYKSPHFNLPEGYVGIGSIATPKEKRKNGYASQLIEKTIRMLKQHNTTGIYLFSDIDPKFYEKFGFKLTEEFNPKQEDHCMLLNLSNNEPETHPSYF
jgi:predicted acetyltransferase